GRRPDRPLLRERPPPERLAAHSRTLARRRQPVAGSTRRVVIKTPSPSGRGRGPELPLPPGEVFSSVVMTPPAKAGGFSEERLLAPTAASQATAQVSPCGHLSRLAPEGPIRALKRDTPCSPQGLKATLPALCAGGHSAASYSRQSPALYSDGISCS